MSEKTANLAAALAAVQAELPDVRKTETANIKSDKGSFQYSYADLADVSSAILPLLGRHGLAFITKPTFNEAGQFVLVYKLLHTSGEVEQGEYPLPQTGSAQQIGSAITYGRRYVLCAITGIAPDKDDDGAEASKVHASANGNGRRRAQQGEGWEDARPRDEHQAALRESAERAAATEAPKVTQAHHKAMHAAWNELGYAGDINHEKRLEITAKILGLPDLETSAELTVEQAETVITALRKRIADTKKTERQEAAA